MNAQQINDLLVSAKHDLLKKITGGDSIDKLVQSFQIEMDSEEVATLKILFLQWIINEFPKVEQQQ